MNKQSIITFLKNFTVLLLLIISNMIVLVLTPYICEDFILTKWYYSILIIIAVYIGNSILWPVMRRIFTRLMVMTFGVSALLLESVIYYIVCLFIPGVDAGFYACLEIPILTSIATTIVFSLTSRNYADSYVNSIKKYVSNRKSQDIKSYPGVVMLEIDGLSQTILKQAIDKGYMPTVKKWLDEKSHKLKEWETDLSSQTGASQAGILHGNNKDIIAYRWVEKASNNKIMVSGKLSHAPIIEKRISDGNGLLVDGTSVTNMFSGDSPNAPLTSSRINRIDNVYDEALNTIFLDSYNFQRLFILFLWDILLEFKSRIRQRLKHVKPRLHRTIIYAGVRAGANVILREITTEVILGDIFTGKTDAIYATYVGYDEVAHHSGITDDDVWPVLKQIDTEFDRIQKAIENNDRDYEIVILSDHGQGSGSTFKQRYGVTLGNYVRQYLPDDLKSYRENYNTDHFKDAFIPENKNLKNIREKVENIASTDILEESERIQNLKENISDLNVDTEKLEKLREKYGNTLEYVTGHEISKHSTKKADDSELIVLGSGNLGLIYLTQWDKRLSYEEIVSLFPDLIPGLVKHSGIGFIVVNSEENGGMVIGDNGIYYLENDEIIGENPLKDFGDHAAQHLKRHNSFNNMPDILVNSFYDKDTNEICAFEELIGSHGGLGGDQCRPFIIYPADWEDPDELVGAGSVYKFLKGNLNRLKS